MTMTHDDNFFYRDGPLQAPVDEAAEKWKVMIVDDDEDVHELTDLILKDFSCDGFGLEFLHAYSGRDARNLIERHPDTALMLLDVVMETDNAGLQVVKHVRETLENRMVRIILRTGQPGIAPEKEVIRDYDINDYKEKSELTIQKLYNAVFSALRSYRDIRTIHHNREGLERVVKSSSLLFNLQSFHNIARNAFSQLHSIIKPTGKNGKAPFCSGFLATFSGAAPTLIAGSAEYMKDGELTHFKDVPPEIVWHARRSVNEKANFFTNDSCYLYFPTSNRLQNVAYLRYARPLNEWDRRLLEILSSSITMAFDNVWLYRQIGTIQESAILSLAKLAEFKDTDTGNHIHRVSVNTERAARALFSGGKYPEDIDALFIEQIGLASILHDIGKVGVPESILLKKGQLTEEEWRIIKLHTTIGGEILRKAAEGIQGRNYLALAADIALYHHERFTGGGYPFGLTGHAIPVSARIVAVVDVYDALVSERPYKKPISHEKALAIIRNESGVSFDPVVVTAFLEALQPD
ncbi:MAG: DUF3369 domain-containing protein [Nitrospinae bacterium]|nr:DUF3369 domain-containing protein [Nitrospinota bacterium]